jgi:hypothetical protein
MGISHTSRPSKDGVVLQDTGVWPAGYKGGGLVFEVLTLLLPHIAFKANITSLTLLFG